MIKLKRLVKRILCLMKLRSKLVTAISDTEIRILNDAISSGVVRPYNIDLLKKYQEKYHLVDDALIFI
jgi:hypothetical protein